MSWRIAPLLIVGLSVASVVLAQAQNQPASQEAGGPMFVDRISEGLGRMQSPDADTREAGVRSLENLRKDVVGSLIKIVDPENIKEFSEESRIRAAYLLGEYRAPEAAPVLSKALVKGELGPTSHFDISPYDSPILTALVKIGPPSVPVIIDVIKTTEEQDARLRCAQVVFLVIPDRQLVLSTFERAKKEATAEQASRLQDAIKWANEHFNGNHDK